MTEVLFETTDSCRFCGGPLSIEGIDLGRMPLSNALRRVDARDAEPSFPLRLVICGECALAQLDTTVSPRALFSDYPYFSSLSDTWLAHAAAFAAGAVDRWRLGPDSRVVEIASNDGYLLRSFVAAGIPALGIEPAANVAARAQVGGVNTRVAFFGRELAATLADEGWRADLLIANNVLAHVPDLHDFVGGMAALLRPTGVVSLEFPHLSALLDGGEFDTIYHEHVFYFSLATAERVLGHHGLAVFDAELLPTHGGSLRLSAGRPGIHPATARLAEARAREAHAGLDRPERYAAFAQRAFAAIGGFRDFLDEARRTGRTVAGYGAAAKGATLLNACGATTRDMLFVADRSPAKQGLLLPGCGIPVIAPERLVQARPDRIVILPWNLRDEITRVLADVREWNARFVVAIPALDVF